MPIKKKEYNQLIDEIKRHNVLYFQKSEPEISDYEYDLLVKSFYSARKNTASCGSFFLDLLRNGSYSKGSFQLKLLHAV